MGIGYGKCQPAGSQFRYMDAPYQGQEGKVGEGVDGSAEEEVEANIDASTTELGSERPGICLPKLVDGDTLED